jgi:hypothetical protein
MHYVLLDWMDLSWFKVDIKSKISKSSLKMKKTLTWTKENRFKISLSILWENMLIYVVYGKLNIKYEL